jgi:F0F1-type ATP synthase assembly protein I
VRDEAEPVPPEPRVTRSCYVCAKRFEDAKDSTERRCEACRATFVGEVSTPPDSSWSTVQWLAKEALVSLLMAGVVVGVVVGVVRGFGLNGWHLFVMVVVLTPFAVLFDSVARSLTGRKNTPAAAAVRIALMLSGFLWFLVQGRC